MPSIIDLHTHSTASDGTLQPAELVKAAYAEGVRTLALTDHDTTAGIAPAQAQASLLGMRLVPGIELSTRYESKPLHVVGLNINPGHPELQRGIAQLRGLRRERAEKSASACRRWVGRMRLRLLSS
ncbi:PHP domain-containing protein [Alkalilimnicola ehrlichii]|uniref:PHP domain-containing protein n=1 Tax=Alkalilimnicola ehrlichii TaxID=351052 RepID=UPI001C6E9F50|nr:PHP domain-containing protein [Alkalilimnicola ehrlichii]